MTEQPGPASPAGDMFRVAPEGQDAWEDSRVWARQEAADTLNTYWDRTLPVDPVAIARAQGLGLYKAQLPGTISGFIRNSTIDPSESAEIFVDSQELPQRARFTIAHELGHYRRHVFFHGEQKLDHVDFRVTGQSNPEEYAANEFAGALLMPSEIFKIHVDGGFSDIELGRIFGVSLSAVRVRKEVLGLS